MKVFLTGAFGNIGSSALPELLKQGQQVRCFDLKSKANQKTARRFAGQIEVVWGDICHPEEVTAAVMNQEVVIHLAAIIPPLSEARPDWAEAINVGGVCHLLTAIKALPEPPKLIFASSVALFGPTQGQPPPRTVADPIRPTDHYTHHKAICEQMIKDSGIAWAILRFGAVLPLAFGRLDPLMFEVPLNNRIEFVHTYDVGLALANAVSCQAIWGKTLLIGGGPSCQLYQRDILEKTLVALGIGMFPAEAFGSTPFYTDWMDTTESQQLLQYQRHSFDDYLRHKTASLGHRRYFIRLFRPLIRRMALKQSPYLQPT